MNSKKTKKTQGFLLLIAAFLRGGGGQAFAGEGEFPLSATVSYESSCWGYDPGLCPSAREQLLQDANDKCGVHRAELRSEVTLAGGGGIGGGPGQCVHSCTASARFECVGW